MDQPVFSPRPAVSLVAHFFNGLRNAIQYPRSIALEHLRLGKNVFLVIWQVVSQIVDLMSQNKGQNCRSSEGDHHDCEYSWDTPNFQFFKQLDYAVPAEN